MQRFAERFRFPILAILGLGSMCVTVNIYFPAAKVKKTAEKIVEDVYREKPSAPSPGPVEKPRSWNLDGVVGDVAGLVGLVPAPAWAEDATTVSNATIRALKNEIAQRHRELLPFYREGQVGINRDGYVEVRSTKGLGLSRVATLKRLVDADNAARRRLYGEVARALGLKPQQTAEVQRIFAKQWRDKAQPGWEIQADDGRWRRK